MISFNPAIPPTDRQIREEVQRIRESLRSYEQEQLLLYLIRIYHQEEPLIEPDCFKVVMGFSSIMEGKAIPGSERPTNLKDHPTVAQKYGAGRTEASSLRRALKDYYSDRKVPVEPPASEIALAIERGLAEAIVHISIPLGSRFGYKPAITWSYRPFTPKAIEMPGISIDTLSNKSLNADYSEVRYSEIGTSAEGIQYLADRIRLARRVETTVVRWNLTASLYEGEDFREFKKALRESQAEFVLINGPMKDTAYLQAIKEGFSDSIKERQLKCYQLHQTLPIMNFIIFTYEKEPSEVIYGWGTHQENYTLAETKVFQSCDDRLVEIYQRMFEVLQSKDFSSRVNVSAPTFMKTHQEKCDVVATLKEIPCQLLCELIESKDCQIIKIGMPGSVELENTAISIALEKAIQRNVSVQILLLHPDCMLLRNGKKDQHLSKLVRHNLEKLRQFALLGPLEVKLASNPLSVAYFQVDTTVVFNPFWTALSTSEGYYFVTYSTTDTGKFLFDYQFKSWWDNAQTYNLSTGVIDPVREYLTDSSSR